MFKPLSDRVLVRPHAPDNVTKGGIIIAETLQGKPEEGEVVSVGPGLQDGSTFKPTFVKPGDRVLFNKLAATDVKIGDEGLLLIDERQILGILA